MRTRSIAAAAALCGMLACSDDKSGSPSAGPDAAAPPTGTGRVLLSEVMYHPVLEDGPVEEHEFVELHNAGTAAVDLGGWRITGVRFTFPAGVSIAAGEYLVVAKNREKLLAVKAYDAPPARVLGPYPGALSNDGEHVTLVNLQGLTVDEMRYEDGFPWPIGADALGASDDFLPPQILPLAQHRHMGRSLERVSFDVPASAVANWVASPLDGATPGRRSAGAGQPQPVVEEIGATVAGRTDAIIRAADEPTVRVRFSPLGVVTAPQVEYFVEDQEKDDEPRSKLALTASGDAWVAALPAQKDNAVVRYRVLGDRGGGPEVISPRPSDPYAWHAYFVSPPAVTDGKTRGFQLLIPTARWERLWDNIEPGRVPGQGLGGNPAVCSPNPFWDETEPAILVADGRVYDVFVRHQGSRTNRTNGPNNIDLKKWPMDVPRPARPNPFKPLSWHIKFPRYARLEGNKVINITKLRDQACQGLYSVVGFELFREAGVPAARQPHYVRMFVNGAYYHYMQRFEHIDEIMLKRYYGKDYEPGDLFKSIGARWDEGPYGWGDERILQDHCGYTAAERYDWTYKRITLKDWKSGASEVRDLILALHAARSGGLGAERRFFEDNFDVPSTLSYMAVLNWLSPWDDAFQNHFLYRHADGKWMLLPIDMDNLFGSNPPSAADGSFFDGMENVRANRNNLMNFVKDSFLRAYRPEFIARVEELSRTVLHPGNVALVVDEALSRYNVDEAKMSPAGIITVPMCGGGDPALVAARMKAFAQRRHERVLDGLFD